MIKRLLNSEFTVWAHPLYNHFLMNIDIEDL